MNDRKLTQEEIEEIRPDLAEIHRTYLIRHIIAKPETLFHLNNFVFLLADRP